jgi:hypothetical protein
MYNHVLSIHLRRKVASHNLKVKRFLCSNNLVHIARCLVGGVVYIMDYPNLCQSQECTMSDDEILLLV